jgi:rhodanese-related sulfurtransferase
MNATNDKRKTLFIFASLAVGAAWLGTQNRKPASSGYAVPEVDIPQAKVLLDAGALVIDVRGQDPFDYRHLPAAVLIPLAVLRAGIPIGLAAARERQIVVYCNDGHSSGPEAAHLLIQHGFTKVANMKSGIEGWAGAGLPMVKAS